MIRALSQGCFVVAVVAMTLFTGLLCAEENDPRQPRVVKLTLSPSAPARPALRYQLEMDSYKRVSGNAAPFYHRAILSYQQSPVFKQHQETYAKWDHVWSERPCEGETREQIRAWVDQFPQTALDQLREATRRQYCDFDLQLNRLTVKETIMVTLPEFQELRAFARYLSYRARLQTSEGKFDDALETLRMGYQLGRDANSEPLLICGIIGAAVTSVTNHQVELWIGAPHSPNLYWPLTAGRHPPIDLRRSLEHEVRLSERTFPFIQDSETANRTPEQWRQLMGEALVDISQFVGGKSDYPSDQTQRDWAVTAKMAEAYPIAKDWLLKDGFDAARLESMPVCQVVAIHSRRVLREMADEMLKGANLPPPLRNAHYANIDARIAQESNSAGRWYEPVPIGRHLMPAIGNALLVQARLEEENAGLRTLEAIRAHLAETGKLPDTLDDIKVVPVPVSQATNQPFAYKRTETGATLTVPSVRPGDSPRMTKRYELSVAK
jgi:hypothetical protein